MFKGDKYIKLTIEQARLISGKTQKEVAKQLGIHVDTYRRIEKYLDNTTIGQAKRISQIVGISYDELFFHLSYLPKVDVRNKKAHQPVSGKEKNMQDIE